MYLRVSVDHLLLLLTTWKSDLSISDIPCTPAAGWQQWRSGRRVVEDCLRMSQFENAVSVCGWVCRGGRECAPSVWRARRM